MFQLHENKLTKSQYDKLYELCHRYIKYESTSLDWGTGDGHFLEYLSTIVSIPAGFTIEEPGRLRLNNSLMKYIKYSNDKIQLPFDDKRFDSIFSVGVLEHVRESGGDEIQSLNEIYRILKQEGLFICYHFPNKYSWIETINKKMKMSYSHPYTYSKKDIVTMLNKTGFQLIEHGRYGFLVRNVILKLPNILTNNKIIVALYNNLDNIFSFPFNLICQNHYFVAKKII